MNRALRIIIGLVFVTAGVVIIIRSRTSRPATAVLPPVRQLPTTRSAIDQQEMVLIPGGTFIMGASDGEPHEAPPHQVTVKPFWMDRHEITVAQFRRFVEATGYQADAERIGWSIFFRGTEPIPVDGATWRRPQGPSGVAAIDNQPVVQISWNDAVAYAKWAGKRLPTEAEFEFAARGGLPNSPYSWGNQLRPGGTPVANWYQGAFPNHDTGEDGYKGVAPIGQFPPNPYGLHDISGNVWEWCSDWYDPTYFLNSPSDDPRGPAHGQERAMRGGSYLCSETFCSNYRVAGRGHATPDTGLNHVGFRCVKDAEPNAAPPPATQPLVEKAP